MKAPIEHYRCTVIEIKIDDKTFSTLSIKFLLIYNYSGNNEMRTIKSIQKQLPRGVYYSN